MCAESKADRLEVQEIWRLHLTRNAIMPETPAAKWSADDAASRFYMFDYFDRLVCRRVAGAREDHRFCFGLNQPPERVPPTASHYLTLVSLESGGAAFGASGNPFDSSKLEPEKPNSLSGEPFLSIILVTIVPDSEALWRTTDDPARFTESSLKEFLLKCADTLKKAADETLESFNAKLKSIEEKAQDAVMCCGVFHCVNSGNFCVAVRTNRPELSYHIAMRLRETKLNKGKEGRPENPCFPVLSCWTFSLTGMEYREDADGCAVALEPKAAEKIHAEVVMRFGFPDHTQIREMYYQKGGMPEGSTEKAKHERIEIRTLYGRYDVTLTLKMDQFQRLYPWVCAGKFRAECPEETGTEKEGNAVIKHLMQVLRQSRENSSPGVQAINERILVDADYIDPNAPNHAGADTHANASNAHGQSAVEQGAAASDETSFNRKRQGLVREENLAVLDMMEDLLKKAETLPSGRDEFCHSLHLLRDLWKSYSSLRYQEDSFVNGNMFLAQIWLVLDCVEKYIDSEPQNYLQKHPGLTDEDREKIKCFHANGKARSDLIKSLRGSIQSISHFQKLMQSINQQSLMAPNYEVQMHTDLEKFMVAYTEYARRFLSFHFRREGGTGKQHILPVFMMDVLSGFIKAEPLFLLPYWQNREGLCVSNLEKERLLLSIVLPDIETFGDLYATMPVICHELSHNFRVAERWDRNEALARYILSKTADYVVRLWVARISEQSAYAELGRLRIWLSTAVADCLYQSYCEYCGEEIRRNANIGAFNSNIRAFLMNCFFVDTDRAKKRQSSMSAGDFITLLEQMRRLYRFSDAKWYGDYLNCVKKLKELKKLETADTDLEHMTKKARDRAEKRFRGYRDLSEKLKSLTESMLGDIVEQQAKDVGRAALTLGAYAVDKGLNVRPMIDTIEDVYSGTDIYAAVSVSPQAADNWIANAMSKTEEACWELENQMESRHFRENADLRTEERLRLLIENLRNTASEACQTIKDGNHILRVLWWNSGSDGDAIDQFHAERNILLNRIHNRLRYDIQRMQPARKKAADGNPNPDGETDTVNGVPYADFLRSLWPLYCASQMREVLSPIYMDMEDQSILRRNLQGNVLQIQPQIVQTIVEENVTVYREIFADLGMCLSLGLDEFGYLMVMSHHGAFYRYMQERDVYHSLTERMETVCRTLSTQSNARQPDKLSENLHTYYRWMKDYIIKRLTPAGQEALAETFFSHLEVALGNCEAASQIPPVPTFADLPAWMLPTEELLAVEGLTEQDVPEKAQFQYRQDRYRELERHLEHLWMAVCFTCHYLFVRDLAEKGIWRINWRMAQHFADLWGKMSESWKETDEHLPASHVLRKIGMAYNSGKTEPFLREPAGADAPQ